MASEHHGGTVGGGGVKGLDEEWPIKAVLRHDDVIITLVLPVVPAYIYILMDSSIILVILWVLVHRLLLH